MTGPKHLWSGDWQNESAAASDRLADRAVQPPKPELPAPPHAQQAQAPGRARRRASMPSRRRIRAVSIVIAALMLTAAGAFGLVALLDASGSSTLTAAAIAPRPVSWLGMRIETVPPGAAVIDTVTLGSPGERAGLSPGDVIVEINHHSISGTADIGAAISGLHPGDQVGMQISHGSALYRTAVTLAAPPSWNP